MYSTVRVIEDGEVAHVLLNRPDVRNAFNAEMIAELTDAFVTLTLKTSVRAVVLSGEGPVFSAGADVHWMSASLAFTFEENLADARRMSDMFNAINSSPFAVVGSVHGACLGGGMGLISVCDVVVSADTTQFGFTEARLGIVPSVISRFVVPKIGETWARALFLSAEKFDARLARDIGLVHWVVPGDELASTVGSKIEALRASGPTAVVEAKRLVRDVIAADRNEIREMTSERIAALRASPEGQEGLRAFLDKRRPAWREGE